MNTIVPTSCIAVAGQSLQQWRKLYRNKINMFGQSWTEHVYEFTPASASGGSYIGKINGDPYEIRIYKNQNNQVVWATGKDSWCGTNGLWPHLNGNQNPFQIFGQKGPWIGDKKRWQRSFSDTRFLLSFERTKEDFLEKINENRETYLLYPSKCVEDAVSQAVSKIEQGNRRTIGSYSGPASLSIEELKALGVKVCHKPPTRKNPSMAPGDHVREGFNWGADTPKQYQWFRYGAGYHYHGTVGCNAGWVWYA
ncbi:MAG: hypothetical protein WC011_04170 [Candidatus Paceibacterota bacterium]